MIEALSSSKNIKRGAAATLLQYIPGPGLEIILYKGDI